MWTSMYSPNPAPAASVYVSDSSSPNYSHRASVALMAMLLLANYEADDDGHGNVFSKTLASIQDSHSSTFDVLPWSILKATSLLRVYNLLCSIALWQIEQQSS
jgi:hypothetical protein